MVVYKQTSSPQLKVPKTRMHSSRMRTARSSSRLGGGSTRQPPGAGTPRIRHPPPSPVNRITDTRKNIPFPQLRLRAVIINLKNEVANSLMSLDKQQCH